MSLSIRPMKPDEIPLMVDYFHSLEDSNYQLMGIDPAKLPSQSEWINLLSQDFERPIDKRNFFYVVWLDKESIVGHSNINEITYGDWAKVHLHIWDPSFRRQGSGLKLFKESLKMYFCEFKLKKIICEPHAINPAPNKLLHKIGFHFQETCQTTPGWINFEQKINRFFLTVDDLKKL